MAEKLIELSELGERAVVVATIKGAKVAAGQANNEAFAVSNRCRHLGASLGEGRIAEDGCLECPWHKARYDVTKGTMTRGPQGAVYAPVRGALKAIVNRVARLKRYPVTERDGAIWLAD